MSILLMLSSDSTMLDCPGWTGFLLAQTKPIPYAPVSFGYSMIGLCLCFKVPSIHSRAGGFFVFCLYNFMALGFSTKAMVTLLTPKYMTYFLVPLDQSRSKNEADVHLKVTPLDEKHPGHDYDPPAPKYRGYEMFDVER
ncbi:hypothetical protein BS47DRAFT_1393557 [Hydnum rufescens UP504]|uniref:Uncharacterized protein n=1 Tax=Hydnum rufescens UP504 TaxID=1448309 RepID=A0A9P6DW00_9AGAM|nr:hypothetical protein BS47DRAFT_1393557 [Hydnum rufescens UP504]